MKRDKCNVINETWQMQYYKCTVTNAIKVYLSLKQPFVLKVQYALKSILRWNSLYTKCVLCTKSTLFAKIALCTSCFNVKPSYFKLD